MLNKIFKVFVKVEADTKGAVTGLEGVKDKAEEAEKAVKKVGDGGKQSMEGLKDVADGAKDSLDDLTGGAVSGFGKFRGGIGNVVKAMSTLKGAVAATGIGLLLVAITSLVSYFKNSEEGSRKLAIATEALGIIFNKIQTVLADLGARLVKVFSDPKQLLIDLGTAIQDNITTRIDGMLELLPALAEAIKLAFSGEFAKAGEVAVNAIGKATLGVEDVTGKVQDLGNAAVNTFNDIAAATNQAVAAATKLVDAQRASRDQQQALIVANAQLTKELEGQKKIAEDTTLTFEERGKALDEVDKIQIKLARNLVAQASAEENILRMQIANTANYEEREELETQLAQKQAERIGLETQLQTIEQESGKLRRELDKERADGLKAIADQIFAIEQTSAEAFGRTEMAKIEAKKKSDLAIQDLERDNLLIEANRLQASEEQKQAIRDTFALQRLATEQAAADQIVKINQGINDQIIGIDQATQAILNEMNMNQFAILEAENQAKLDAIQIQKEAAVRAAQEQGVDTTALAAAFDEQLFAQEDANAQRRMQLEAQVADAKMDLASRALGVIGGLFKQNSKAAKAFALGQAVMDTYRGINAALATVNPIPGGRFVEAALVGIQGLANVKRILSTKEEGATAPSSIAAPNTSAITQAPVLPQLTQGTTVQANQIGLAVANQISAQPIKTYVSTRDINTAGEFNRLTTNASRL